MQLALIIIGSWIVGLVIAGTQDHDIWSTDFELIRRTDSPTRRPDLSGRQGRTSQQNPSSRQDSSGWHSQPGTPSQSRRSPLKSSATRFPSLNLPDDLMPSAPRESKIFVDVHGPGKFNGWPNPSPDMSDTNVEQAQRRTQTYRGTGEVAAKALSHPYQPNRRAPPHQTAYHMIKMESTAKKVAQSVTTPRGGDGHISVLSPGERIPVNIPVPADRVVKVTAQTPDERGVHVRGSAQRGGEIHAHATNAEDVKKDKIKIETP